MTTLVLTLVGDDRAGIVAAVAETIERHGGNWENSRLAELAGAFAGIVQVSVAADRADALRADLDALPGLQTVTVAAPPTAPPPGRAVSVQVLGNDSPGIVREIAAALTASGSSIERMTTETRDAAMSGGRLFEASITAILPARIDPGEVRSALERVAAEIQVDLSVAD
jgi:glycine cleavage system regulatory protein